MILSDRFELQEVIASSEVATVWRAEDRRLRRTVAVKIPTSAAFHDRFRRCARAAAGTVHRHVVRVLDAGESDGRPFLVMEYLTGETLAAQPGVPRVQTIAELAGGLAALHSVGIVHGHPTPANVLLTAEGARLTSFAMQLDPAPTARLLPRDAMTELLAYVAPEVLAGSTATGAADVYALGTLLEQAVSSQAGAPPPGSDRARLAELARSCNESDPADRPTAHRLAQELEAFVSRSAPNDTTVTLEMAPRQVAPPPVPPATPPSAPRWERLVWPAVALVAILSLTLLALLGWRDSRDSSAQDAPEASPVAAPATTSATPPLSSTTATSSTTSTTSSTTTTRPDPMGMIDEALDLLTSFLDDIPPNVLKPNDGRDIIKRLTDAVAAFLRSDASKVENELDDALDRIEKELEGTGYYLEARSLLFDLAATLDVTLEP